MAVSAGAVAARVAARVAADKRLRRIVLGIVLGVFVVAVAPAVIWLSVLESAASIDFRSTEVLAAVTSSLSPEQRAELGRLDAVMKSLESEYKKQGTPCDFIKVQIICLCALNGMEPSFETFYEDFIACFVDEHGDGDVFANIEEAFGITFTAEEKNGILRFYAEAAAAQMLPQSDVHRLIAQLMAEDGTPVQGGSFGSPFRDRDYKTLITSGYGKRTDPVTGEPGANHTGLDMGVPVGTDVYAVKPGKVILVERGSGGYGNCIAVSHGGGAATLYGHLSSLLVREGQMVGPDTVIAKSGNSGKSTGPHLHLEIIIDGQPVNPKPYLP
jgi:murein DD-endopeptidase MepM/ murein hydrolase activator NlpD